MLSANVIETNALYITNIIQGGGSNLTSQKAYGKIYYYTTPLVLNHIYVYHYKYKFNGTGNPTLVNWYWAQGTKNVSEKGITLNANNKDVWVEDTGIFIPGSANPYWAYDNQGSWKYGAIYAGPNDSVTWTSYYDEVFVADVTELCTLANYQITTSQYGYSTCPELVSTLSNLNLWKNANNVSVSLDSIVDKLNNNKGITGTTCKQSFCVNKNTIECDGMTAYSFNRNASKDCYFDNSDWLQTYNNTGGSTAVTHKRVIDTSSPFYPKHQYVVQVKTIDSSLAPSPGLGGIVNYILPEKGRKIVEKIVAKIPVGYSLKAKHNSLRGGKYTPESYAGTGKYEEYTFIYNIGTEDADSYSIGHLAVYADNNTTKNVTWYIAYINYCDVTNTNINDWCAMPGSVKIKSNNLFTSEIDSQNRLLNGNGSDINMELPSKYKWVDGKDGYFKGVLEGWCAIEQEPVTTDNWYNSSDFSYIGQKIQINPLSKYKITFRVYSEVGVNIYKFFPTIFYYKSENDQTPLKRSDYEYTTGTKTQLSQKATKGATTLYLKDVSKWQKGDCQIGFRSSVYQGYFIATETNTVTAINTTANTITLQTGLSAERAKDIYIYQRNPLTVELSQPDFYEYVRLGSRLASGWNSFEMYLGTPDVMWDGRRDSQIFAPYEYIPFAAKYMTFCPNMGNNKSASCIFFDNIRIDEIYAPSNKLENNVQIKHYDVRKGRIFDPDAKYSLVITFPSPDGDYNTKYDKVSIDGNDYSYSESSVLVNLTSGKHTISYKPQRYTVYGRTQQQLNTLIEWVPTNITITNGEFIMPSATAGLTWTYSGNEVYKVSVVNKTDTSSYKDSNGNTVDIYPKNHTASTDLKIGDSYKTCSNTELYFPVNKTVYWQLNPKTDYIYPVVTFTPDSICPSSDDYGSFTMPKSDVTIYGISYHKNTGVGYLEHVVKLSKLVDPGSVIMYANGTNCNTLSTSGTGAYFKDYIQLQLQDGYTHVTGYRKYVEWDSIKTNDVKLNKIQKGQYSFTMPFADVTITPSINTYYKFKVSVNTEKTKGCTIGLNTANSSSATNNECWVEKKKTVFVGVTYSSSAANLCDLTITDNNNSILKQISDVSTGTGFSYENDWPQAGVKIYGVAREDIWICPFDGFVVYSISCSSGSRLLGNTVNNQMEIFDGFNNERGQLPNIEDTTEWSNLSYSAYTENPDFGDNPVCHMGIWSVCVFCAFSVRLDDQNDVQICVIDKDGQSISEITVKTGTDISAQSTYNDLTCSFIKTAHPASGKDSYFGTIYYNYYQKNIVAHNIFVRIENVDSYLINLVYDTTISNPPFYPDYTPYISQAVGSIIVSPVRKVGHYYQLDATTYDRQFFNIADVTGMTPENINILLTNFDEVYMGFAYSENVNVDNIYGGQDFNPRQLFDGMFYDYQQFNRTYSTNISVQDNILAFTIAELQNDENGLTTEELANVRNQTGTLIVTIGTKQTIFTFFIGELVDDTKDIKSIIKDTDNSNMWAGNYVVHTSTGDVDAQCLNIEF